MRVINRKDRSSINSKLLIKIRLIHNNLCADPTGFEPATTGFPPNLLGGRRSILAELRVQYNYMENSIKIFLSSSSSEVRY